MLNIVWCYPDILNLHGDRGNIFALQRIANILEVQTKVEKVENYNQKINYKNADIILFNVGELKVMPSIIESLRKQEEELREYVESGKMIILIGTSGCIMAKRTVKKDASFFRGLSILNMECTERKEIYGNNLNFHLKNNPDMEIMADQIQVIDTTLHSDIALGIVKYGMGNNGKSNVTEGARYKNVIFTNALGPVLVKNPWYTEQLIRTAMETKGEKVKKIIGDAFFETEIRSMQSIGKFINNKKIEE